MKLFKKKRIEEKNETKYRKVNRRTRLIGQATRDTSHIMFA